MAARQPAFSPSSPRAGAFGQAFSSLSNQGLARNPAELELRDGAQRGTAGLQRVTKFEPAPSRCWITLNQLQKMDWQSLPADLSLQVSSRRITNFTNSIAASASHQELSNRKPIPARKTRVTRPRDQYLVRLVLSARADTFSGVGPDGQQAATRSEMPTRSDPATPSKMRSEAFIKSSPGFVRVRTVVDRSNNGGLYFGICKSLIERPQDCNDQRSPMAGTQFGPSARGSVLVIFNQLQFRRNGSPSSLGICSRY